jgi:hypothetical protein
MSHSAKGYGSDGPTGSEGVKVMLGAYLVGGLVVPLLGQLEREGGRRGLATLCVGVGQGVSLLVERV